MNVMNIDTAVICLVYSNVCWLAIIFIISIIRFISFTRNKCCNNIQEQIMQLRHEITDVENRLRLEIRHERKKHIGSEQEESKVQVERLLDPINTKQEVTDKIP